MNTQTDTVVDPDVDLPETLPEGERVLWEGRASGRRMAQSAFHTRKLATYFAALIVLRIVFRINAGVAVGDAVSGSLGLVILAAISLAILTWYAHRLAQESKYTISNRRIILRTGIALPVTISLPFAVIDAADLRLRADGSGDIALRTDRKSRVSWVLLWPMVRPFRLIDVRPVLRAIEDAESVAATLSTALANFAASPVENARRAAAAKPRPRTADKSPRRQDWGRTAAAALVVIAVLTVSLHQLYGERDNSGLGEPAVASVQLFFEDLDDGGVAVIDASNGLRLETLEPGSNSFLRGLLRSFTHERRAANLDDTQPFALLRTESGRIVIQDLATGRVIDLRAFGKTNLQAVARFLSLPVDNDLRKTLTGGNEVAAVVLQQEDARQ